MMKQLYRQFIIISTIVAVVFIVSASIPVRLNDLRTPQEAPPPPLATYGQHPQFVLLAFDGSQSIPMWEETRQFARDMSRQGKPVYFTYFVSGVYFLNQSEANHYQPPSAPAGTSLIGFAASNEDIRERVHQVNEAFREGHEIASHANGHFNGATWTKTEWDQEFDAFNDLLFGIEKNNPGLKLTDPLAVKPENIVGFRAPQLGANTNMDEALAGHHFRYDASRVSSSGAWPQKNAYGLWELPLATIVLPSHRTTITMDYSIFALQTGAHNLWHQSTPDWQAAYQDIYNGYLNYFNKQYNDKRAPIFIGHHFSTWNDSLYWQVMKDFAANVCGKPDVYCVTHVALANYLDRKENQKEAGISNKPIIQPESESLLREIGD